MISVIIPTYNGANVLAKYSLPSLMKQSFTDWEALIIDDDSSDASLKIAKHFAKNDSRIRVINKAANTGLAASLNLGLAEAKGEIISVLEHDDIWLPDKLLKQKEILEKKLISMCRAAVYDTNKQAFTKINGGNLSCLAFKKEISGLLFPIPEENKRFLGIEDGIITARIEMAIAQGHLQQEKIDYDQTILTIMNANNGTLSGQKNHQEMKRRYRNIIDFYYPEQGKYPKIDKLISFWKKHYHYNQAISRLPKLARNITYSLMYYLKNLKNKRTIKDLKKTEEYLYLINYRQIFH